jgi:hypothetical protein
MMPGRQQEARRFRTCDPMGAEEKDSKSSVANDHLFHLAKATLVNDVSRYPSDCDRTA